jgi:phospholipase/carboxylesterase
MTASAYLHRFKAPSPGAPLLFAFHGTGGDENQFFGLLAQILPDAGLVAPRGDVSENGANRYFRRTGEGVYDMPDLAARVGKMAGFIAAHKAAHPGAPVFGMGYSNGANILAAVMLTHPDLIDRAALLHPLIPWTPDDQPGLKDKRILITAGQRDPICPTPLTEALARYFAAQGAEVSTTVHSGGHEMQQSDITALQEFLSAP